MPANMGLFWFFVFVFCQQFIMQCSNAVCSHCTYYNNGYICKIEGETAAPITPVKVGKCRCTAEGSTAKDTNEGKG